MTGWRARGVGELQDDRWVCNELERCSCLDATLAKRSGRSSESEREPGGGARRDCSAGDKGSRLAVRLANRN